MKLDLKLLDQKLNRRMKRGIGIREFSVKINNDNERFLKELLI